MSNNRLIDWQLLVSLEPQLQTLSVIVRSFSSGGTCSEALWHNEVKPKLRRLLGEDRKVPHVVLSRQEAYDIALHELRNRLAPCVSCRLCGAGASD